MAIRKTYANEREGQMDFFDLYGIDYRKDGSILVDNTDGVYHGNILEFKLNINNTGKVLFQAIKYLSRMRIKGESVPARILLIDLNATKAYAYSSIHYINDIQKVYTGAASKGNEAFAGNVSPDAVYDYSDMMGSATLRKLLINKVGDPADWYVPIDIDENCIVGWAERYYREVPKASKGDFLGDDTGTAVQITGEIRNPRHFRGLINPYTGKTNEKFMYLMDCLNSRLAKKDLGAFYTPEPYAKKAGELVMKAVERVPEGNDYIILDRCAGSGALEAGLIGLKDRNGDELISHCVVSTYEYYEYKVLMERIGDLVRDIIPPTEANIRFENGVISNADAMSEEYINNPIIKGYVDNPKCTIILFENPPYRDIVADNNESRGKTIDASYVFTELKSCLPALPNSNISTARDLSNQFIWSGFKYYLRQDTDSYILFSPIKYWKSLGLCNKTLSGGYLFNRKYFHASASSIACLLWMNIDDTTETINLPVYDIKDNGVIYVKDVVIKKAHSTLKDLNEKRVFSDDTLDGVYCAGDGYEAVGKKCEGKPHFNENIIGYLNATDYSIDAKHVSLLRCTYFGIRGGYLRKDAYLTKLPLFAAKQFSQDAWYDRDIYFTTADSGDAYTKDDDFLKSCLIYTALSNQNKCLSFTGSDGRYYRNELCLDDTHGDTVASADLKKMALDDDESRLMELWCRIMSEAKGTANYDSELTYGVYQITKELNTFTVTGSGRTRKKVYDYPVLNGYLTSLRDALKVYYKSHITKKMFEYELLK